MRSKYLKKFEEFISGNLEDLAQRIKNQKVKGELVLIIDGVQKLKKVIND